jgi:aspartyl-tRNA(Asn)/glutamyl-tRNA(Gln) amidotransferase subunit B
MLPAARRERLAEATGLPVAGDAVSVIVDRCQDDYAFAVRAAGGDLGRAVVHLKEAFAESGPTPELPAADLARLTRMEIDGTLTATQAKSVLADLLEHGGGDAEAIAAARGFEAMDTGALDQLVDEAIAAQPDAWAKFCAGEGKAMGALVGHIMKASKGQADGKLVSELLHRKKV